MIIGITGGTGSGKTTLLHLLEQQGVLVLDCDAIYHELLTSSPALLAAIESRFPGTVEGGRLQRKKLGTIVFSDETALHDLNKITHSAIHAEVRQRLEIHPAHAAIDAIALFESGMDSLCDVTVAVTAPADVRLQRLMARDCISAEYAQKRMDAQPSEDWFRSKCNYTLENNGTEADFHAKCLAFLQELGIMKV
jgi:dephospho-CoA kinase